MKFSLDQDVYYITARFLLNAGYDVILATEIGLDRASDEEILKISQAQNRILITRDRDYGNLVFVKLLGTGVIYLRMLPANIISVHKELLRVLEIYSEEQLLKAFVVIESNGHRFRKTP